MNDEHILVLAEVRIPLDRIVDQVGAGVSSALLAMGRNEKSGTKKSRTLIIMQRVEETVAAFDHHQLVRGTPGEREAQQRLNAALVRLRASYLKQQKG
jgi:hypothetical protein